MIIDRDYISKSKDLAIINEESHYDTTKTVVEVEPKHERNTFYAQTDKRYLRIFRKKYDIGTIINIFV